MPYEAYLIHQSMNVILFTSLIHLSYSPVYECYLIHQSYSPVYECYLIHLSYSPVLFIYLIHQSYSPVYECYLSPVLFIYLIHQSMNVIYHLTYSLLQIFYNKMESKILNCDKPFDINNDIRNELTNLRKSVLEELENKTDYFAQRLQDDHRDGKCYSPKVLKPFKDYCDDEYLINCEQTDDALDIFNDEDLDEWKDEWREASLETLKSYREWSKEVGNVLDQAYQSHYNAVKQYLKNKTGTPPLKQKDFMTKYVNRVLRC